MVHFLRRLHDPEFRKCRFRLPQYSTAESENSGFNSESQRQTPTVNGQSQPRTPTETRTASEQHLRAESSDQQSALSELQSKVRELSSEKVQLTSLMDSLEQTRSQLVNQLQETQRVLDLERDMRNQMLREQEKTLLPSG